MSNNHNNHIGAPPPWGANEHTQGYTLALATNEPWMLDGLCAQTDPEIFYPEQGGSNNQAKSICRRCPVMLACLEFALRNGETIGVWGGLSPRERAKLDASGPAACRHCGRGFHSIQGRAAHEYKCTQRFAGAA